VLRIFFEKNENARGCKAHEREGAKKALSWGVVFKNHKSQKSQITKITNHKNHKITIHKKSRAV
jgi:hypothetical protein